MSKPTKQHMLTTLDGVTHWFGYDKRYSVSIKLNQRKVSDAVWTMMLDEHVGQYIWDTVLIPMIDEFKETNGVRVYTGGRSDGWLYLDIPVLDGDEDIDQVRESYGLLEKLEALADAMFASVEAIAAEYEIVPETYTVTKTRNVLQEKAAQ